MLAYKVCRQSDRERGLASRILCCHVNSASFNFARVIDRDRRCFHGDLNAGTHLVHGCRTNNLPLRISSFIFSRALASARHTRSVERRLAGTSNALTFFNRNRPLCAVAINARSIIQDMHVFLDIGRITSRANANTRSMVTVGHRQMFDINVPQFSPQF